MCNRQLTIEALRTRKTSSSKVLWLWIGSRLSRLSSCHWLLVDGRKLTPSLCCLRTKWTYLLLPVSFLCLGPMSIAPHLVHTCGHFYGWDHKVPSRKNVCSSLALLERTDLCICIHECSQTLVTNLLNFISTEHARLGKMKNEIVLAMC
jgi:hypothetical protein